MNEIELEKKLQELIEMMGNHPDATKLIDSKLWSVLNVYNPKYEDLVDDSEKLAALEAGGVDNWEWYSESLKDYFDDDDDNEEEEVKPKNENSK